MSDELVVIQNCISDLEADLVISELADAGIDAVITQATMSADAYPSMGFVTGVDVAVRAEDADAARAFLELRPNEHE
jgi:hypothetical protein